MISDEAVEAAAKAAFSRTHPHGNWRLAINEFRVRYLAEARAALEAAAPYIAAAAWDEGHERGFWNGRLSSGDTRDVPLIGKAHAEATNPYTSGR